jgi:peptidoglycan/LPS O-acetylase OafA/YrhL
MVMLADHRVRSRPGVAPRGRLIALDGLRGIAAIVVVFHHIYQTARPFIEPSTNAWAVGSLWWFISSTPIKLLSAGSEAVLVFFVLSGLVVPLPLIGKGVRTWLGFFASRLVRLYVPVWASLVLAGIWINTLPHPADAVTAGSWVARTNGTQASLGLLFSEAGLMRNSFSSNSVLWSLRWELIFSLALPLFVLTALAVKRYWAIAVAVCFALTIVGKLLDIDALLYLPVFFLGTLVAVNLEAIRSWAEKIRHRPRARVVGWFVTAASVLSIVVSWMLRPILKAGTPLSDIIGSLTPVGALGLVACAIAFGPVARGLSARVPQWLGKVSFSLYLTHLPILVALIYLFGDRNWALVALVGVPLVLCVAYLFHRFVEAPSHRLARLIGSAATGLATHAYIILRARHVSRLADTR